MKKVGALVNLAQWYSVFTDKFYTFVKLKFGALDLALGPSTTNFHFLIVKLWYFTFCRLYEWLFPQTCLPEPISGLPSDTDQETTPKKNLHPGKSFDQQKHRVQFSQNFCYTIIQCKSISMVIHLCWQPVDWPTVYTNDNWFVILLSHVYFGDWVTEIWHFSPLKTNNSIPTQNILLCV